MNTTPAATHAVNAVKNGEGPVTLAVTVASGMVFLAGSTVSIALPAIQARFGAAFSSMQWILNAYVIALAALIVVSGNLGDRYGTRRVFLLGIAVFALGSLLSAFAPRVGWLIGWQALMGIGAALMIPAPLAVINTRVDASRRNRAIGLWAGASAGIAALGPFIGGFLVERFGWQAVFLANLPLAILAFVLVLMFVPRYPKQAEAPIDAPGAAALVIGLASLSYGLITGPGAGWNRPDALGALIIGILALGIFLIIERTAKHPAVPLGMFRNPLVAGANLATLFLYFGLQGTIVFLVFLFQQVLGYPATYAGLALLPTVGIITLLSGPAGGLADRLGPRPQMIAGPFIVGVGFFLLAFVGPEASYLRDIMPGLILFGIGMGLVIAPLTRSALSVDAALSGTASGVNNAVSRTAGMLAIALLGAVMATTFTARLIQRLPNLDLDPAVEETVRDSAGELAGMAVPDTLSQKKQEELRAIVRVSFIDGFRRVMWINALLAFLAAIVSIRMIPPERRPASLTG